MFILKDEMTMIILMRMICLSIFFTIFGLHAMDQMHLAKNVLVVTNDNIGFKVPLHHISQMSFLQCALNKQGGKTGLFFPIHAPTDSQEFQLLNEAITRVHNSDSGEDLLKQLYDRLAQEDGLLKGEKPEKAAKILYTLGEGKLRMLINAAGKVGAEGLSAAFKDYFLSFGAQDDVLPLLIDSVISFLHKKSFEKRKTFLPGSECFEIQSLFFSSDSKQLLAGNYGESGRTKDNIVLWDISDISKPSFIKLSSRPEGDGHPGGVNSALFTSDGKNIVVGYVDYENKICGLNIIDISDTNKLIYTPISVLPVTKYMKCVALSSDDNKVVVGYKHSVVLYDISNKNKPEVVKLLKLSKLGSGINHIAISHDGKLVIVSGGYKKVLVLIDISDMRKPVPITLAEQGQFYEAAFSPDNKKIIVYGKQGDFEKVPWNLVMWDISDIKNPRSKIFAQDIGVGRIAFGLDGRKIIFCKNNDSLIADFAVFGNLILWDIENTMVGPFNTGPVNEKIELYADRALAISSDYKKIIAGDEIWGKGLLLSIFLSDEEIKDLKSISVSQGNLLHKLICLNALGNGDIVPKQDSTYYTDFMRLPEKVRELLLALA